MDNSLDFMAGTSLLSGDGNVKMRAYMITSKESIAISFSQVCELTKYSLSHGENLSVINLFLLWLRYIFTILDFEKTHTIYKSIKCVFVSDYTGKICLSP